MATKPWQHRAALCDIRGPRGGRAKAVLVTGGYQPLLSLFGKNLVSARALRALVKDPGERRKVRKAVRAAGERRLATRLSRDLDIDSFAPLP